MEISKEQVEAIRAGRKALQHQMNQAEKAISAIDTLLLKIEKQKEIPAYNDSAADWYTD